MYRCHAELTDITRYLRSRASSDKKDHTTVMYARDKVKHQMEADEVYRNRVRQLLALCQND